MARLRVDESGPNEVRNASSAGNRDYPSPQRRDEIESRPQRPKTCLRVAPRLDASLAHAPPAHASRHACRAGRLPGRAACRAAPPAGPRRLPGRAACRAGPGAAPARVPGRTACWADRRAGARAGPRRCRVAAPAACRAPRRRVPRRAACRRARPRAAPGRVPRQAACRARPRAAPGRVPRQPCSPAFA